MIGKEHEKKNILLPCILMHTRSTGKRLNTYSFAIYWRCSLYRQSTAGRTPGKHFPFPSGRGRKPWLYRIYRFQ